MRLSSRKQKQQQQHLQEMNDNQKKKKKEVNQQSYSVKTISIRHQSQMNQGVSPGAKAWS